VNPWLREEGRGVLEATFGPEAIAPLVREAVRGAVADVLGREGPGVPRVLSSPEGAAADVVDRLAEYHARELTAGEQDLSERLAARFGPSVLHHAATLNAVDWVMHQDRGGHAVARGVVGRDLAEAFAAPAAEREPRVGAVLDGERARMRARAGTRVARATREVLAALRLPDAGVERVAELSSGRLR
jgi:hypothetical protein